MAMAAPWLFLPAFALALLVAPPPPLPSGGGSEDGQVWAQLLVDWAGEHGGWYVLAHVVGLFGTATLYALYLLRGATVREAMATGLRALPRLVLATLVTGPAIVLGLSLWLVPGLYVMARLVLVGPALVAERQGVLAAIGASVRRTRGQGLALTTAVAVPLLGGWLAGQPFLSIDRWMRDAARLNPVALGIVDAGAAATGFAATLAQALVAIVAYRRLAR
jgi:hypothetical protein